MKNKKQQFLEAVRILAPGNQLFLKLASRVNEAELPRHPGGVALEFVAGLEKLTGCSGHTRAQRKSGWPRSTPPARLCRCAASGDRQVTAIAV